MSLKSLIWLPSNYTLIRITVDSVFSPGGGGGVLGLKKGTNCGLTAAEMAKKRGAVLFLYCKIRELSESLHPIFYIR